MAVTPEDLRAIFPPARTESDEDIQVHLDTANLVVDEQLRPKCPMTAERYDKITLYLAAHFMALTTEAATGSASGGALRRSKLGDADESYATPTTDKDYGYNSTRWGQMALALDTCSILSASQTNRGIKAEFRVVGNHNPGWN